MVYVNIFPRLLVREKVEIASHATNQEEKKYGIIFLAK